MNYNNMNNETGENPPHQNMQLHVSATIRYWEDATVNGKEDSDGSLIPCRQGDNWCSIINLSSGQIKDWPKGTTANIHYKVCDSGEYWLKDNGLSWKYKGNYVPDRLLCIGDRGYGDYIILQVNEDGFIKDWQKHELDMTAWEMESL